MNEPDDYFMYRASRAITLDANDDIHLRHCLNYSFIQFISDDSARLSENANGHEVGTEQLEIYS